MKKTKYLIFTALSMIAGSTFAASYSISNDAIPVLSVQSTSVPITFTVHNDSAQPAIMYVNWNAANLGWKLVSTTCSILNGQNSTQESKFTLDSSPAKNNCDFVGTFTPINVGMQSFAPVLSIHEGKLLSIAPQKITVKVDATPSPTPIKPVVRAILGTSFPNEALFGTQVTATYDVTSNTKLTTVTASLPTNILGSVNTDDCNGLLAYKHCRIIITLQASPLGKISAFKPSITVNNGTNYQVAESQIDSTNAFTVNAKPQPNITLSQNFTTPTMLVKTANPTAIYTITSPFVMNNVQISNLPKSVTATNNCNSLKSCSITLMADASSTANSFGATTPVITINGQAQPNVAQFDGINIVDTVNVDEVVKAEFPNFPSVGSTVTATYEITNNDPLLANMSSIEVTNLVKPDMTLLKNNCDAQTQTCQLQISYAATKGTKLVDFQPKVLINGMYRAAKQSFKPATVIFMDKLAFALKADTAIQKVVVDPLKNNNIFVLTKQNHLSAKNNQKLWESQDRGATWSEINLGNLTEIIYNNETAYIRDFKVINNNIYAIGAHLKMNPSDSASVVLVSPVQQQLSWSKFENNEFDLAYQFSMDTYISSDKKQISMYILGINAIYEKSLIDPNATWKSVKALGSQILNGSLLLSSDSGVLYSQYVTKTMIIGSGPTGSDLIYGPVLARPWNWQSDKAYMSSQMCVERDQLAIQHDKLLDTDIIYNIPNKCGAATTLNIQNSVVDSFKPVTLPTGVNAADIVMAANNDMLLIATGKAIYASTDKGNVWTKLSISDSSALMKTVFTSADGVIMATDSNNNIYFASY
jgi:hypothetical protein